MSRPHKQTVDYFPHYSDASSRKTLFILESKFGNDGYTFWFKLLELLSSSEGHFYDVRNPASWEFLLAKAHVTDDIACKIITLLSELEAIDKELWVECRVLWSQNLVDNVADAYRNRKMGVPPKPSINSQKPISKEVSDVSKLQETKIADVRKPQMKLNETKLYNIYTIFNLWNELKIIIHKKINPDIKQAIDVALREFSVEDVSQAIQNYAEILKGEQYYFKYTWTLKDFLKRGLEKFLDLEIARQNYLKEKEAGRGTHQQSSRRLPPRDEYTKPEDYQA